MTQKILSSRKLKEFLAHTHHQIMQASAINDITNLKFAMTTHLTIFLHPGQ